jgi:NAD(P)-dependent dehydrogenase (short-subunit alcohol dehydrogenase family)
MGTAKKVALVTGGSRGIGLGIAEKLAADGFNVVISGRRPADDVAATVARLEAAGVEAMYCRADNARAADREAMLAAIRERFGRLDCLVNNAGVAPDVRADILEAGEDSYDRVMTINLKGPYFLTQAVARWMVEQRRERPDDSPSNFMSIVFITSCSAYAASPSRGEYCLSKAGLAMAAQLYAARLAEAGVNVYEVRPGIIETDMTSVVKDKYDQLIGGGLTPIRRWGRPEDVGKAVAACARGDLPFSTGEVINVDGGFQLRTL